MRCQIRPILLALLACALLLVALGCDSEPAIPVDFNKRQEIDLGERETALTYAYLPQYTHSEAFKRHHLLVSFLQERLGRPVRQVFPDTFEEHIRMVGQGKIDISYVNPATYVQIADQFGARVLARVVESWGNADFRGQIICRDADERIKDLQDVRGKRWIAVDPNSAGGFLYPLGHFVEHGIMPQDFADISFAPGPGGKQEKVVLAVYSGEYDVGSIREGTLQLMATSIDLSKIRVLAYTRWYPGWCFAARGGLSPELTRAIQDALLELSPRHNRAERRILDKAELKDIVRAQDQDFDSVRDLMRRVDANLF